MPEGVLTTVAIKATPIFDSHVLESTQGAKAKLEPVSHAGGQRRQLVYWHQKDGKAAKLRPAHLDPLVDWATPVKQLVLKIAQLVDEDAGERKAEEEGGACMCFRGLINIRQIIAS